MSLLQQEAVTLLESRDVNDDIPEEGDVAAEAEGDEEEAEDAARALLGLPGVARGTGMNTYALHCCATNLPLDSFRQIVAVARRRPMTVCNCLPRVLFIWGGPGLQQPMPKLCSFAHDVHQLMPLMLLFVGSHIDVHLMAFIHADGVDAATAPSKSTTTILPPPLCKHEVPCSSIAIAAHASLVLKHFAVLAILAYICPPRTDSLSTV